MEFEKTIKIKAADASEAIVLAMALKTIAENLTSENIKLLAEKSKKSGMNEKLQKYKHAI